MPHILEYAIRKPITRTMPQLVPFYFVNQLVYGFSFLFILLVLASQYFLPRLFFIFLSRIFITKL